jgi:hypothetical protein
MAVLDLDTRLAAVQNGYSAIELPVEPDVLPDLLRSDAVNLAGQDTGRQHLSHTALSILLSCQRKYELHYLKRLSLVSRPRPFSMGSAFQKAVELGDPDKAAEEILKGATILSQEDQDRAELDQTITRAASGLYLNLWGASTGTREFEYRVRLRNPWTGRYSRTFDLLGYADELDEDDDGLVLVENKLVGSITDVNVKRLPLDRQVALACYGVWRATGREVVKVRYRFVRKPSIKQRQTETPAQFRERLTADYEARPDFYSHEETLYRSTEDLVRIEGELWTWADQLRRAEHARLFPRNSSVCHEYGGCQFLSLCSGDSEAIGLYRVRESRPPVFSSNPTPQEIAA